MLPCGPHEYSLENKGDIHDARGQEGEHTSIFMKRERVAKYMILLLNPLSTKQTTCRQEL